MTIKSNRFYNDPGLANAAGNLADLFGPPSGSDMSGYASANAKRQETEQRAYLWAQAAGDTDRQAVIADLYDPTQSYKAVEMDDATKRYGYDTQAASAHYGYDTQATTSRANNADDNTRAIATNAADNTRALTLGEEQALMHPVAPGEVINVPPSISTMYDVPAVLKGTPKPLSETEVKGGALTDLITRTKNDGGQEVADELIKQSILGTDVTPTLDANGQPTITNRFDAANKTPILTGEQKTAPGLDTYVDSQGKTFVGHSDAQGNVFKQDGTPAPDAQRKGAPSGDGNKIEGVDDYIAIGPDNKEVPFVGYFDPADKKVHRSDVPGNPVMEHVVRKGVSSGGFSVKTNPDGTVEITQGSPTGKNPTAEQARANYVGIQSRPAVQALMASYDSGKLPSESDYYIQHALDMSDDMDAGGSKMFMDWVGEKFGRTNMTPQGMEFYGNVQTILPLNLLIQSGAAVNEKEATRKRNELYPRPSDTPGMLQQRRNKLGLYMKGLDEWAQGKIDKVDVPEGITAEAAPAATAAPAGAVAAPAATTAPAAAQPAPAATAAPADVEEEWVRDPNTKKMVRKTK
jgi:hypothetical protein